MNKIYWAIAWWFACLCTWCSLIGQLIEDWKLETVFIYKYMIGVTIVLMSFMVIHAWRFVMFLWKQKFPNKGDYLRYSREED